MNVLSTFKAFFEGRGRQRSCWKKLPLSRRFIVDYLHFSSRIPSQALVRICDVSRVDDLRKATNERIGWSAILLKAFAIMAREFPELSTNFMKWPWAHFYEHPHLIGRVAVSRKMGDEQWLLFARIEKPESLSLSEIQQLITHAQFAPPAEIPQFQIKLRTTFSRLPKLLRMILWWSALNFSGSLRAGIVGTVGLTSVATFGVTSIHPPCLGNIVISSGPVGDDGKLRVTFVYDHRVFDGAKIAEYLALFEEILNDEICVKLKELEASSSLTAG